MDQLTAHLDHGWDLAQRGDAQGALASARRAIEIDPDSPEAYNLLGYSAALNGDIEEALEAYEQALGQDDTYVEAMLNAAELYLHPLGEYDEVIALCDQVLELSEYDDEILDARLLQLDAYLGRGETDRARELLAKISKGPFEHAGQYFLVGKALLDVGDHAAAEVLLEEAITKEPNHADALYHLGLTREERGDRRGAVEALLRSRESELAAGVPPWAPNAEAFRLLTEGALAELDPTLQQHLEGADVFVSGMPGAEVVVDGVDPRALALIEVVPPPAEDDGSVPPDVRVFVYALNVVKAAGGVHAVQQQIRLALEREVRAVFANAPPEGSAAGAAGAPPATND